MNYLQTIRWPLLGAALTLAGCSREREAEPISPPPIQGVSTGAVQTAPMVIEPRPTNAAPATNGTTAQGSIEVLPKALEASVTNLQAAASVTVDPVQGVLDAARNRIDEKKWAEALSLLDTLSGQQLTLDQQTVVRNLKDEIQQALRSAAPIKIGQEVSRLLEDSRTPR